jgi:hypothetical protein
MTQMGHEIGTSTELPCPGAVDRWYPQRRRPPALRPRDDRAFFSLRRSREHHRPDTSAAPEILGPGDTASDD